jgi:hypothetical protein
VAQLRLEPPPPEKIVYEKATVTLQHHILGFVTTINYFGDKRDDWLNQLKSSIPIEILKLADSHASHRASVHAGSDPRNLTSRGRD